MSLFEELFQNHIIKILKHVEKLEMADFTKLNADNVALTATIADLSTKLDAFIAKQVLPIDEQPAVDAAATATEQNTAAVAALAAKIA